jgi:hypothetical protein
MNMKNTAMGRHDDFVKVTLFEFPRMVNKVVP